MFQAPGLPPSLEIGMEAETTKHVAQRMRSLRKRRGWTATELGKRMAGAGVPWDRSIVANVENHKRHSLTINELLALARVLDVAPIHLLVPIEDLPFHVAPNETCSSPEARAWIRGERPLPESDVRTFFAEVPLEELGH